MRKALTQVKIKQIREEIYSRFGSVAQFANQSGLHRNCLVKILNGDRKSVNDRTAYKIETMLEIEL